VSMTGALSAFIIALVLGGLLSAVAAEAQEAVKVARIGFLILPNLDGPSPLRDAFRRGLRDLGYAEGRNFVLEIRSAEGKDERYPALAKELAALKVDVIVVSGAHPPPWRPSKRPGTSRLSSSMLAIRWRAGSSPALRDRRAISQGCRSSLRS